MRPRRQAQNHTLLKRNDINAQRQRSILLMLLVLL